MRLAAIHALTDTPRPISRGSTAARRGLLAGLVAAVRNWLARRAVLAELHELDDRTLTDLSIYPGDFPAIADGTYVREGGAHDRPVTR